MAAPRLRKYRALQQNALTDPALEVDENCVLVLKNCGPKGYPGMAEVGNMGAAEASEEAASPIWCGFQMPA